MNTAALLMDVSAFSKYIRCEKIHGIIGNNLMRKANWQIDYQHQIMRLASLDKNFATSENALQTKMNANTVGNVKLNLTVNIINETYTFDTGFNGFAQTGDTSFLKNTTPITKVGVKGATFKGAKMGETHLIKIDSFQLNGLNFKAPNHFVVKPDNGAVLGNEFYENFVLTLNWSSDTLTLDPINNPQYSAQPIFDISFFTDYQAQTITVYRNKVFQNKLNQLTMEQKLLKSEMNPHFIFNSLSYIQSNILQGENQTAVKYLVKFSKLLRYNLEQSTHGAVKFNNEIKSI